MRILLFYLHFLSYFTGFTDFSLCVFRVVRGLSLLRVSIPHKPAVGSGGGCSLSSRTASQPKNKMQNTLDYEIVPADGV